MNRLLRCTTLRLAFGCAAAAGSAGAAPDADELDTFAQSLWPLVEASPQASSILRTVAVAAGTIKASYLEDPWALNTSAQRQDARPLRPGPYTTRLTDYSLTNGVNFANAFGVTASASLTDTFGRHERQIKLKPDGTYDPEAPLTAELPRTHRLQGQIAYDVIKGGDHGEQKSKQRVSAEAAVQQRYSALDQLLQLRMSAYGEFVDLYVTTCELRQLGDVSAVVAKTVKTGEIQVAARTLSSKDYLTFINLANNFELQQANLESTRISQLERIYALIPGQAAAIDAALAVIKSCKVDVDSLLERALAMTLDAAAVARRLPATAAARAGVEVARTSLQVTRFAHMASVSPFVSGSYMPEVDNSPVNGSTTVGVNLTWTLPVSRAPADVQIAKISLEAANAQLAHTRVQNEALVASLKQRIESQRRIFKTVKVTIDTSEKLLRAAEVQVLTGSVDALTYANAYLQKVNALQTLLDSYGALKKVVYQMLLYKDTAS